MSKEDETLVSVIVPAYNVEKYIDECLYSVRNQTHKNLEIIVINDASTDDTAKIIKKHVKEDPRVIFVDSDENSELSATRNKGLTMTHGEYVCFIDADDIVHCNFFEVLASFLDDDPEVDIAQCILRKFHTIPESNRPSCCCCDFVAETQAHKSEMIEMDGATFVMQSNKMFRRKIFKNIRFPEGRLHEDLYVIYDEYTEAKKIIYTTSTCYYYRVGRSGAITSQVSKKRMNDMVYAYDHMRKRAVKNRDIDFAQFVVKKELEDFVYLYSKCKEKDEELLQQMQDLFEEHEYMFTPRETTKFQLFFENPRIMGVFFNWKAKKCRKDEY